MCLAVPAQITELLADDMAMVRVGGVSHRISLSLVEKAQVGDYVIVHVGYALSKMDPEEAAKTLALFDEYNEAGAREALGG
ncbi:MAG: HypC/HybG/HupF family hydrogenase formation chaperone [Alphaproteobacteria bacterium]|nr:HypC/HybG/HupF family hydrogenase formation chaperone [Alphaproteobacteria bacterium]